MTSVSIVSSRSYSLNHPGLKLMSHLCSSALGLRRLDCHYPHPLRPSRPQVAYNDHGEGGAHGDLPAIFLHPIHHDGGHGDEIQQVDSSGSSQESEIAVAFTINHRGTGMGKFVEKCNAVEL